LYVIARINSLIKKSQIEDDKLKVDYELFQEREEKRILLLLADYPEIIAKALENYNPSVITKYCFDVAQAFNEFYNKHQILNVKNNIMMARFAICKVVKNVLINALGLLTIYAVDEM
jgi:arginyl-tRNA synthetase